MSTSPMKYSQTAKSIPESNANGEQEERSEQRQFRIIQTTNSYAPNIRKFLEWGARARSSNQIHFDSLHDRQENPNTKTPHSTRGQTSKIWARSAPLIRPFQEASDTVSLVHCLENPSRRLHGRTPHSHTHGRIHQSRHRSLQSQECGSQPLPGYGRQTKRKEMLPEMAEAGRRSDAEHDTDKKTALGGLFGNSVNSVEKRMNKAWFHF